jgi:hypothetical protein
LRCAAFCGLFLQNWFDACVERTGGDRHAMQVVTTRAPAAGLGQGADGIIYIAHFNGILAGYLADYEVPNRCLGGVGS